MQAGKLQTWFKTGEQKEFEVSMATFAQVADFLMNLSHHLLSLDTHICT